MIKVKTFHRTITACDSESFHCHLDDAINSWIEEGDKIIKDITYTISGNKHYGAIGSVLITYKEKKVDKK